MTIDRLFEQVIEYRKRGWNCGDQITNIRNLLKKGESSEKVYKQIKDSIEENIKFLIDKCGASEESALKLSIEKGNKISFSYLIRRKILSREDIKGLKINNETLIKELIEYIYEENGLETRTLENKIMRPEKFDEETKKLIIEIVSKTHPERANILKIRLNLK